MFTASNDLVIFHWYLHKRKLIPNNSFHVATKKISQIFFVYYCDKEQVLYGLQYWYSSESFHIRVTKHIACVVYISDIRQNLYHRLYSVSYFQECLLLLDRNCKLNESLLFGTLFQSSKDTAYILEWHFARKFEQIDVSSVVAIIAKLSDLTRGTFSVIKWQKQPGGLIAYLLFAF